MNPDTAERCDCGYDFQSGKVEKPYIEEKLEIPRWIPIILAIAFCMSSCRFEQEISIANANGFSEEAKIYALLIATWWIVIGIVYRQLAKGRKWAKFVLAILAFPVGLAFLFSRKLDNFIRLRNDQNNTSTETG